MNTARWPVHPAPTRGEALTSWLIRLAAGLHVDIGDIFIDLGCHLSHIGQLDDFDIAAPARFARRLAVRTGVPIRDIRRMRLVDHVPGLIGTRGARNQYAAYTRRYSILLPSGRRPDPQIRGWLAWTPGDGPLVWRVCRHCLPPQPPYPYKLAWALPIMLTCHPHRCWLEPYVGRPSDYIHFPYREPPPPSPAVRAMDQYTTQALITGRTLLPGGTVTATTWVRMLRTIIDEQADPHEQRQYENLEADQQDQALEAAANTIAALQRRTLTGHGAQARLLRKPPQRRRKAQ